MKPSTINPLKHRDFVALLTAQFLGSLNDNLFKMVVSLFAIDAAIQFGGGSAYLSLASAVFIIPYLLLSGPAGACSDIFTKRTVLVATKLAEIVVMVLAASAIVVGCVEGLIAVLLLMATQSTFFSPAKYGILPELLSGGSLVRANGWMELARYLGIIIGTVCGSLVMFSWRTEPEQIGWLLIAIAVAGALAALPIRKSRRFTGKPRFQLNPWSAVTAGLRQLRQDSMMALAVAGLTLFDLISTTAMLTLLLAGKQLLGLSDLDVGALGAVAGLGAGLGSLLAGRLCRAGIRSDLPSIGLLGVGVCLIVLGLSLRCYPAVVGLMFIAGLCGGLVFVPLNALLQERAGPHIKGQIIATNNFCNMAGVLLASALLWILHDLIATPASQVLLLLGLSTLALVSMAGRLVTNAGQALGSSGVRRASPKSPTKHQQPTAR